MLTNRVFCWATASLWALTIDGVAAETLSASIDYGQDSNPYRLSNAYPVNSANFHELQLKIGHQFDNGLFFKGSGKQKSYQQVAEFADYQKSNARIGIKNKVRYDSGAGYGYLIQLGYDDSDTSYVSRLRGEVGTFRGESVRDRYDATWLSMHNKFDWKPSKSTEWTLGMRYRDKTYQSFEALGMSNLDYQLLKWYLGTEYKTDDAGTFGIEFSQMDREFDDKRAKDLAGDSIDDSDLEYSYQEVELKWRHRFAKHWYLRTSYQFETREDNAVGYYDTDNRGARVNLKYKWRDKSSFEFDLRYYDNRYVHNVIDAELEEEEVGRVKTGYAVEVSYEKVLTSLINEDSSFGLAVSYDDYDNTEPFYQYDRLIAYLTVTLAF